METPLNAVAAVILEGLVQHKDGSPISAIFHRHELLPDMVQVYPVKAIHEGGYIPLAGAYRPDGVVPRSRSTLPPSGDVRLSLKLGKFIGDGRSGIVFEAEQLPTTVAEHAFPPLVVKVVRQERCQSGAREAWFYDHLECLQGVVIPRCYGWFGLRLTPEWEVPAWSTYPSSNRGTDAKEGPAEFMNYHISELREKNVGPSPLMTELAAARDRLFILVMERVGDWFQRHPTYKSELSAAYTELAHMSVDLSLDIKGNNVCKAPVSPPGLPSLPSPLTGRTHNIRLLDLELALWTDWSVEVIVDNCESYFSFF
ncbi:hypothetical protein EXIGLDRAFT_841163 [Exidia glandulosa HHB12029]|uniref:Protein kinase domain-containing protein n=1 Tax=Exidia glandulosa HHB12029 TaxID=1314781 RepID=A0A165E1N6_EXIGL|nr:hypothetical protein EXIGLDRAFT_841163 [Exidia glandulosa HHB12029]